MTRVNCSRGINVKAVMAALRRASSSRPPIAGLVLLVVDVAQSKTVAISDDETCLGLIADPGRRKAARGGIRGVSLS